MFLLERRIASKGNVLLRDGMSESNVVGVYAHGLSLNRDAFQYGLTCSIRVGRQLFQFLIGQSTVRGRIAPVPISLVPNDWVPQSSTMNIQLVGSP